MSENLIPEGTTVRLYLQGFEIFVFLHLQAWRGGKWMGGSND